tara:strand:+ start:544 stop:1323 length:780 start_codon:yes stop_codon:yes gene_type:complete
MAIPASGSVSFSQIQSEWGGSNPISLSEYYSGSLATNSNPNSQNVSVGYSSKSIYTPASAGGKGVPATPAYTSYYRQFGFMYSQFGSTTAYPAIGQQTLETWTFVTGRDQVGNAGQIPSSGAIQMNHFRGTSSGPASTSTVASWGIWGRQAYNNLGGNTTWGNHTIYVTVTGWHGTTYTTGNNWTNVPFRYIDLPAKDGFPATRLYGSDTHQNSGWVTSKGSMYHNSYVPTGNYSQYSYTTNNNTNINMSGTWTISITV